MKTSIIPRPVACALLVFGSLLPTHSASLDTNQIESVTGLQGTWSAAEGVFRISQPRNDVGVKVDEWKMPPFMGLTSWAGFLGGRKADAMVMGDLVLFEDEVNPVLSAALDHGLEVTALHNHLEAWEKDGHQPETPK